MMVINQAGTAIDFDAATLLMDNEILDELDGTGFTDCQEFFSTYEDTHIKKFGIEWELSRKNPTW